VLFQAVIYIFLNKYITMRPKSSLRRPDLEGGGGTTTWLTGALEAVSDAARPADAVDERAVHVAPEVIRAILAVLVHQPQAAADHLLHQGHARPAQVVLVHHLHAHQLLKGELQIFMHLAEEEYKRKVSY